MLSHAVLRQTIHQRERSRERPSSKVMPMTFIIRISYEKGY